jgi:hypothetical protein
MSIEITLEADARLNRGDIKRLLEACGATGVVEKRDDMTANFPESKMAFLFRDNLKITQALTDGMEGMGWVIGSRMTFRYVIENYDKCESELRRFVEKLAGSKEAFFVVAFQYEGMRAIRDQRGLRFFE